MSPYIHGGALLPRLNFIDAVDASRLTETWISLVRVLALLTLVPAFWLEVIPWTLPAARDLVPLLGAYVIFMTLGSRRLPGLRRADLIIVLDVVMITLLVVTTGNLKSPFLYLYYLTILEAAVRLNLRQALAASIAMAAIILFLWVQAGHHEPYEIAGFRLGVFVVGGFFLAIVLGMLVQEHRAAQDLARAYDTALEGWSRALDLRDQQTEGHSRRVTEMTLRLGHAMGLRRADLVHLRRGALLHDIGKMGIPDSILHKPGRLTAEEREVMDRHPVYAYELLSPIAYLRPALDIPYCHHEKWDGTGYPRGLRGEQIPLAARIFAVADVWDALRWDRVYRPALTVAEAREYLHEQAGRHFDPRVVEAFLRMEKEAGSGRTSLDGERSPLRVWDARPGRPPRWLDVG